MAVNFLLSDLAHALTDHDSVQYGGAHFVDLTAGDVTFVPSDYMLEDDEITEEDSSSFEDWEQDIIRIYRSHDLVQIDPISSSESFQVMEEFTELCSGQVQQKLRKALDGKHPFSAFRSAAQDLGIIRLWYDFKDKAEQRMSEEWLGDNGLAIQDGKIVRATIVEINNED